MARSTLVASCRALESDLKERDCKNPLSQHCARVGTWIATQHRSDMIHERRFDQAVIEREIFRISFPSFHRRTSLIACQAS